jgi:hypothetical protein
MGNIFAEQIHWSEEVVLNDSFKIDAKRKVKSIGQCRGKFTEQWGGVLSVGIPVLFSRQYRRKE